MSSESGMLYISYMISAVCGDFDIPGIWLISNHYHNYHIFNAFATVHIVVL